MNLLRNCVLAIAVTACLLAPSPGTARAQGVEYGAFSIKNTSSNTLYYDCKWGWDNYWTSFSLAPNTIRTHYTALDGNRTAPTPYVRFDNAAGTNLEYRMEFFATFDVSKSLGKCYLFRYSSDGRTLNLYAD
jgi:hypothetical protein